MKTMEAYRGLDQPDESHFADLLNDLMHLANRDGIDFTAQLQRATSNFEDETN